MPKKEILSEDAEQFSFILNELGTLCKPIKDQIHVVENQVFYYPEEISEFPFPVRVHITDKCWKKNLYFSEVMDDFLYFFSGLKKKEHKDVLKTMILDNKDNETYFSCYVVQETLTHYIRQFNYNKALEAQNRIRSFDKGVEKLEEYVYEIDEDNFDKIKTMDFPIIYFLDDGSSVKISQDDSFVSSQTGYLSRLVFDRKLFLRLTSKDKIIFKVYLKKNLSEISANFDYYKLYVINKKYEYIEYIKALHI